MPLSALQYLYLEHPFELTHNLPHRVYLIVVLFMQHFKRFKFSVSQPSLRLVECLETLKSACFWHCNNTSKSNYIMKQIHLKQRGENDIII